MNIQKTLLPAFLAAAISLSVLTPAHAAEGEQQFADLGECKLESGEVIKDCRIGYRTRGTLNADRSNAVVVLLPIWDGRDNSSMVINNEAKWIDPSKHFVVVVDTIGNKVSIGPDNSKAQPGQKFPKMTVRDMMEINRRLMKEDLKLDKVYAIMGEQLGGMQALQWMIAYPDEMEKVIAVTTTPKSDAWDFLGWQSQADILSRPRMTREDDQWAAMATGSVLAHMVFGPPIRADAFAQNTKQRGEAQFLLNGAQSFLLNYGLDRQALYARAIANHNAYKGYGDTAQKAADRAKAKLLAFVLPDDLYTSTLPMLELARLMNARVVELNKGLIEPNIGSESPLLQKEIQSFLAQ